MFPATEIVIAIAYKSAVTSDLWKAITKITAAYLK